MNENNDRLMRRTSDNAAPVHQHKPLTVPEIMELIRPLTEEEKQEIGDYWKQRGQLHPKHSYVIIQRLIQNASATALRQAWRQATTDGEKIILFRVAAKRKLRSFVPLLTPLLHAPESSYDLRWYAADTLGDIGSPAAGPAVLAAYQAEAEPAMRSMFASVLGGVRYPPAIPDLIAGLQSDNSYERKNAAWSLGALHATEAQPALAAALEEETNDSAQQWMWEALQRLTSATSA